MTSLPPINPSVARYYEHHASVLTTNSALKALCVLLAAALVITALDLSRVSKLAVAQKPIVIRVSDVGKAEAVNVHYQAYTPQDAEIRYFLIQFIRGFYSRNHRTIRDIYPAALFYLSAGRFAEVDAINRKTHWEAKFLTASTDEDTDVSVKNIAIDDANKPLYRAQVQAETLHLSDGKTHPFIVTLHFHLDQSILDDPKHPPEFKAAFIRYNPLCFQITDYRDDQALTEDTYAH